jgi:hypothetical protein
MSLKSPSWVRYVYLGLALWLWYIVGGFFLELALIFVLRTLWPEISPGSGPLSWYAILVIQLTGVAILPGLMLGVARRRRYYLVTALLVPFVVSVVSFGLMWIAAGEEQAQVRSFMNQVLPRLWIGTLVAMAYAYDRRNLPGVW